MKIRRAADINITDLAGESRRQYKLIEVNPRPVLARKFPWVIELDRRQPEFTLTLGSYFKNAISAKRISMGKEMLKKHASLLRRVFERYRVQPRFLVAFWGLESNYGEYTGVFPVVGALVPLSHDRRRATFFRQQLLAVLQLIDKGDFPLDVKGAWAGAMGNHQFIPLFQFILQVLYTLN